MNIQIHIFSHLQRLLSVIFDIKKSKAAIFMFHKVVDKDELADDNYTCSQDFFIGFLKKLNTLDFKIISLDDAMRNIEKNYFEKYVTITFDDVSDSFYYFAYPLLKSKGIPFTFFVTIDYIDKPGYLTKDMLIELASDELCTIGSHTLSHPLLRKCKDPYQEIYLSKLKLEELVGRNVNYFAYPYGSLYAVKKENIKQARNSGFEYAFSSVSANLNPISTKNKFFLPRINVNNDFDLLKKF